MAAKTITITPGTGSAVSFNPIPQSANSGGFHIDRGGKSQNIPIARAGEGSQGECLLELGSPNPTWDQIKALRSGPGEGDRKVEGNVDVKTAYGCLVDVQKSGDAVQLAHVIWKGTTVGP